MKELKPEKYEGDDVMQRLLRDTGCRLSVREVRALLKGVIAAPRFVMPNDVVAAMYGAAGPRFESQYQAERFGYNLMHLHNSLVDFHKREVNADVRGEYARTRKDLRRRLEDDERCITWFLRGLHLGGTDFEALTGETKKAVAKLREIQELFDRYLVMLEAFEPSEGEIKEVHRKLDEVEEIIESQYRTVARGLEPLKEPRHIEQC